MPVYQVKGEGITWKEAKSNLEEQVNSYRSLGIRFVGIAKEKGQYCLGYENNGKLKFSKVKMYTEGISLPFRQCPTKYIEGVIFYSGRRRLRPKAVLKEL